MQIEQNPHNTVHTIEASSGGKDKNDAMFDLKYKKEGADGENPIVEEKVVAKKKIARRKVDTENLSESGKGLYSLYKKSKEVVKKGDKKNDIKFIGNMLREVRDWKDELEPRFDYAYFLERVRKVGKEKQMSEYMAKLRSLHVGEMTEQDFLSSYPVKEEIVIPSKSEEKDKEKKNLKAKSNRKPEHKKTRSTLSS